MIKKITFLEDDFCTNEAREFTRGKWHVTKVRLEEFGPLEAAIIWSNTSAKAYNCMLQLIVVENQER